MDMTVYNADLEVIGVIDVYISLVWRRRYFSAGDWELTVPASRQSVALLSPGNLICRPDDEEPGIIRTIRLSRTDEGDTLTVSGPLMLGITADRFLADDISVSGHVDTIMRGLVANNMIQTTESRVIPHLALGQASAGLSMPEGYLKRGVQLSGALEALALAGNIGHRIRLSKSERTLYYDLYEGIDRSVGQQTNPHIIFSHTYDNLLTSEYTYDDMQVRNAVTAEYREGSVRLHMSTGDDIAGYARRELYVEGDCVKDNLDSIAYPQTYALLGTTARDSNIPLSESYIGEVDFLRGYKSAYDLGDIVTVCDTKYGLQISDRIYELDEYYEHTGNRVVPIFGAPERTISDIFKEGK